MVLLLASALSTRRKSVEWVILIIQQVCDVDEDVESDNSG